MAGSLVLATSFQHEAGPPADPAESQEREPEVPWGPLKPAAPWYKTRMGVGAIAVAGLLLFGAIGGGAWFVLQLRKVVPEEYVEVFVTDLPAGVQALDLQVSGVYVGQDSHALQVEVPMFDIVQLQGPGEAMRLASGFVPAGNHSVTRIVFSGAYATINGSEVELQVPEQMLTVQHGLDGSKADSAAVLLDIDLDQSLQLTEWGLIFTPRVSAVYLHEFSHVPGRGPGGLAESSFRSEHRADFSDKAAHDPRSQYTSEPSSEIQAQQEKYERPDPPQEEAPAPDEEGTGDGGPNIAPDLGGGQGDNVSVDIDAPEVDVGFILQHDPGVADALGLEIDAMGLAQSHAFPGGIATYVVANESEINRLAQVDGVQYIEREKNVSLTLDSSRTAVRSTEVTDALTGLRDAQGAVIDGSGVGVAVVDSGIDASHPDLPYDTGLNPDYVVAANYKVESLLVDEVDVINTDTTSGHGTHVAGIIAGQGIGDPSAMGVAPGAKLYGFGVGESSTTLWTNQALAWILENHDQVDPPIRVVSNSWTTGTGYDPNALSSRLVRDLVDDGVVVVFAAGNFGGDGTSALTSGEAVNPKEGVISVANYDDGDTGSRAGSVSSSSSRGYVNAPWTWPDLSAPGSRILSTTTLAGVQAGVQGDQYREMSGTSMAAPHVSGVVALMLQADPSLTPAQVESVLETTAHGYTWGGSYATSGDARYSGSHYAKGHGLLDAEAAVLAVL